DGLGDDGLLDLGCAFVDPQQAGVAVEALGGDPADVAGPAVHLHAAVGDAPGHLAAEVLGRRRTEALVEALVVAAGRAPRPRAGPLAATSPCRGWSGAGALPPCTRFCAHEPTSSPARCAMPPDSAAMCRRPGARQRIAVPTPVVTPSSPPMRFVCGTRASSRM